MFNQKWVLTGMPQDTVSATLMKDGGLEVEEDRIDLLVLVKGLSVLL